MDPNKTLKRIRRLVSQFQWIGKNTDLDDETNELVNLFDALDEWITKGGAYPKAWNICSRRIAKGR